MPRRRCLCLAFLAAATLAAGPARADSPLTSTDLATSYSDLPAVAEARRTHQCGGVVLEFLLSGAPNDQKAAVVNALGWQAAENATLFLQGFAHAHNLDPERLEPKNLSVSERFVAGYLMALEGYLDLKPLRPNGKGVWGKRPLELLDGAAKELPDDFAVQYVRALVKAQEVMEKSWCEVFKLPQGVLDRFPAGKRNLRPGAVESVQGYLSLYEKECPGSKAADKEKLEQLNQIYTLVQLGGHIVAGTQGGVVVWDPTQPTKPVTTREEFICGHVVVLGDSAWAGCDKQVLRWDGRAFRSYLKNDANDATYYEPMLGKAGQLWVRYGAKTFAYEPQADRFKPVDTPWPGSPYDALVRKNGEVWWIDFLKSLDTTSRRYALKSQDYPGRDPRRLVEDATGTLWVEDFESGFFHLDAHSGQFVQEPGIESRASGVAFDLRHERLFLLHYRQGLTVTLNHRAVASIDLSALQYMRDLMLDQAGDVWVAGWTELVRLREQDGNWSRTSYRVR